MPYCPTRRFQPRRRSAAAYAPRGSSCSTFSGRCACGAADHRDVFAEFAVLLVFIIAEQMAAAKSEAQIEGGAMRMAKHRTSPLARPSRKREGHPLPRRGARRRSWTLSGRLDERSSRLRGRTARATSRRMGAFCGYASLFGEADLSRDMVMPGAFRELAREARGGRRAACSSSTIRRRRSACGRRCARMRAGSSCAAG